MKVKGIPYAEVKAKALQNPDVMAAYLAEKKEEELQELLADLRRRAGINSTQVAERMGITQPAVSKLEKTPVKPVSQHLNDTRRPVVPVSRLLWAKFPI